MTIAQSLEETEEGMGPTVFESWKALGEFTSRAPLPLGLQLRSRESMQEALSVSQADRDAIHIYVGLLMEGGMYEQAKAILEDMDKKNRWVRGGGRGGERWK